MWSKAAEMLGHPPGVKFRPDEDELVEFFLLPRVRGEPSWFPGVVVIDDDTAANTHPSKLLERHGLAGDEDAYFFVRTADAAARQDRHCAGGGRWVSQKPVPNRACIGGQEVQWRRVNLNLQPSRGKSGGGSNGWVMHEYSLTEPPCPFLKICHVTFSGHGKDAKRVPDGEAGEPAPKRARVAAAAAASSCSSTCVYGSTAPAINQGYGDGAYLEQVQHHPMNQQLQPVESHSAACAYGSTTTVADQDASAVAATDEESLEWFRDYVKDLLADAAEATAENAMMQQQMTSGEDEGNKQLLDYGTCLPADAMPCMELQERLQTTDQVIQDAQLQPVESSFCSIPSAAELFPQHGLDEQEKQFWRSIGVDTDNIVC
ncbi:unnamed protein product [Urochloa decumbens]|uniref:NAC domain-containing protein n=1 Tax=Urochloa decumbens TaxID=240449 RepID=A0ABC9ELI3_9POAL